MWTSRVDRQRRGGWTMRIGGMAALVLALALSGCGTRRLRDRQQGLGPAAGGGGERRGGPRLGRAPRDGQHSRSVRTPCPVAVAVRNKNPNADAPRIPGAVLIHRYEVSYSPNRRPRAAGGGRSVHGQRRPRDRGGRRAPRERSTCPSRSCGVRRSSSRRSATSRASTSSPCSRTSPSPVRRSPGTRSRARAGLQIDFADYGDTNRRHARRARRSDDAICDLLSVDAAQRARWPCSAACLLALPGCVLDKDSPRRSSGPSETGISVQLSALPDTVNADGVSQSVVELVLRDQNGSPAAGPGGPVRAARW